MKERGGALWPCVDEVRTDLASKIRLLRCFVPSHLVPLPVWNADEAIAQQLQVVLLQQGAPCRPKESLQNVVRSRSALASGMMASGTLVQGRPLLESLTNLFVPFPSLISLGWEGKGSWFLLCEEALGKFSLSEIFAPRRGLPSIFVT